MDGAADFLVAGSIADRIPVDDRREPLRALVASLARGGAERIVLEWLAAEQRRGRAAELAVLHSRRHEYRVPPGVAVVRRGEETAEAFVSALAVAAQRMDARRASTLTETLCTPGTAWSASVTLRAQLLQFKPATANSVARAGAAACVGASQQLGVLIGFADLV